MRHRSIVRVALLGLALLLISGIGLASAGSDEPASATPSPRGPQHFDRNVEITLTVESKESNEQVSIVVASEQGFLISTDRRDDVVKTSLSLRGDVARTEKGRIFIRYHVAFSDRGKDRAVPAEVSFDGSAVLEGRKGVTIGRSGDLVFRLSSSEKE